MSINTTYSLNSWRKRFIKIMTQWCTCLFCIGWLGNVQRFITRAEPLYDSLNPLFCDVFAAVVVCARSLLLWSIKSHDADLSLFFLLLYMWFKPRGHWKLHSQRTIIVFHNGKRLYHLPWKLPEIRPGIFWSNGKRPYQPGLPSVRIAKPAF